MNRFNLLKQLDGLLETCKVCDKRKQTNNSVSPEIACKGCQNYAEIRMIGENLGRKKQMARVAFDLPVSDYIALQADMNKREIAKHLNVSEGTLYAWINKNASEIKKHLNSSHHEITKAKPSISKEDKTTEQEQLIKALRSDLLEAHNQLDEKDELIRDLNLTIEKFQHIDAACDDVESELISLREELEQEKNRNNELSKFENLLIENKALKELLKVYL